MANERDIGSGIAAFALVQSLGFFLRSKGTISNPDLEKVYEAALSALEQLKPPDDVAVQDARRLVENALQGLVGHPQSS